MISKVSNEDPKGDKSRLGISGQTGWSLLRRCVGILKSDGSKVGERYEVVGLVGNLSK